MPWSGVAGAPEVATVAAVLAGAALLALAEGQSEAVVIALTALVGLLLVTAVVTRDPGGVPGHSATQRAAARGPSSALSRNPTTRRS
jgi:lysylphosphatidylglycerol synthetase-like protein (DUF2156 family)